MQPMIPPKRFDVFSPCLDTFTFSLNSTLYFSIGFGIGYAGLGARHFTFHSFRVGCAVSQTIAGKDIAEIMTAVNWKSEKVARRYVGGATNTRDPTGTTPGAAEARYVTANDLAASLDPAVWALFPPPPPPPVRSSTSAAARATSPGASQGNIPRA